VAIHKFIQGEGQGLQECSKEDIQPTTLHSLLPDAPVWIRSGDDEPLPGHTISPARTPKSYNVSTPDGELRGTRYHLTE